MAGEIHFGNAEACAFDYNSVLVVVTVHLLVRLVVLVEPLSI
jgi:hypothetical protein